MNESSELRIAEARHIPEGSLVRLNDGRLGAMDRRFVPEDDYVVPEYRLLVADETIQVEPTDRLRVHLYAAEAAALLRDILSGEAPDLTGLMVFTSETKETAWWIVRMSNAGTADEAEAARAKLTALRPDAAEFWRRMYANRLTLLQISAGLGGGVS